MAEPAGQDREDLVVMALGRKQEGRRAGPPIEILVAAADRKIGLARIKRYRHRAGAVTEVPDHRNTLGVRLAGQGGHVVQLARLVVRVGQKEGGDILGQGVLYGLAGDQGLPDTATGEGRNALHHIGVSREVAGLGEDDGATGGKLNTRAQGLEDIHGC